MLGEFAPPARDRGLPSSRSAGRWLFAGCGPGRRSGADAVGGQRLHLGGADLRHRAGHAQGLLRDRLPAAEGAGRRVHQAVPERQVGHPRGPVRGDHAERAARPGRRPAGPDAPAAGVRAGQGRPAEEPRRLRAGVRLGQVAGLAARAAARRRRRPPAGRGLAVRDGPQLQHDRRVLQQEAGRADRHDRAADDAGRARRAAAEGQGGRASRRSCSSTAAPPAGWRSRCRT